MLRLMFVPALVRLETAWPVHQLWSDPGAKVTAGRTALRVWREGFRVHHAAMDAPEAAALARASDGEPFAAVCDAIEDPSEAAAVLLRWLEDGMVVRVSTVRDPDVDAGT
jgi:hypothetical protein